MIIHNNIKSKLQIELQDAISIWIASAMISQSGWQFVQTNVPENTLQHYLIGIDLSTEPSVFQSLFEKMDTINARVYQSKYTFHPKVYLIQKNNNSFTAFVGSSNTTNWGLEKNVEMNFQINDQTECIKLLVWFNSLYTEGKLITEKFVKDYSNSYLRTKFKTKEIEKEIEELKKDLTIGEGQFFSKNEHTVFEEKYHYVNNDDVRKTRRDVHDKFKNLHNIIYPQFSNYGLLDLHCHHQSREIVSRHFFNKFSGNYINAMWLHYGKSKQQLSRYENGNVSINRPDSFINNIRFQVIIHDDSIGIWLVLGRSHGSKADRDYFRSQMQNPVIRKKFYDAFKNLGDEYYIHFVESAVLKNINSPDDLWNETRKERIDEYYIIGCDINWLDERLSTENLSKTVLEEFQKLYPLYEIMRH